MPPPPPPATPELTVNVMVVEWETPPDVAVTMTVEVPEGVPPDAGGGVPPVSPAQPAWKIPTASMIAIRA